MRRFGRTAALYGGGGAALGVVGVVFGLATADWGLAAFSVTGLAAIAASFYFDARSSDGRGRPGWQWAALFAATVVLMAVVYIAT